MTKLDLLAIGEVMAELRRNNTDGFSVGFAGDTFNTAVYVSRTIPQPQAVGYLTRIGSDPLSEELLKLAREEFLDVSGIAQDQEKQIGIYAVSTDQAGERSFSYWRDDSAARRLFGETSEPKTLPSARVTYLSGITLAILSEQARQWLIDHLAELSSTGKTLVAFDSNYRPRLWEDKATAQNMMRAMWNIADIALPSIDDEMDLYGDETEDAVIARFAKRCWQACAIKRGERGPVSPTLPPEQHPSFPAAPSVVDTTAAGDSFNGGYLAALLAGEDEARCLTAGHKLASTVVGFPGAITPRAE